MENKALPPSGSPWGVSPANSAAVAGEEDGASMSRLSSGEGVDAGPVVVGAGVEQPQARAKAVEVTTSLSSHVQAATSEGWMVDASVPSASTQ